MDNAEATRWSLWKAQPSLTSPLNELYRSNPSDVMSRYSTSAIKEGSTHVALGILTGFR